MEDEAISMARQWFYKHVHEMPIKVFCWDSMGEYSHDYWIKRAGGAIQ